MNPSGCEGEVAARVPRNLTLFLNHLAVQDVAFHSSELYLGLTSLFGCSEAEVVGIIFNILLASEGWPDPSGLQSVKTVLDGLQTVLAWIADVGGRFFNTMWPILALLAKLQRIVLKYIASEDMQIAACVYEPRFLPTQTPEEEYLRSVWLALDEDKSVPEDASLKYLSSLGDAFPPYSLVTALFALLDCCPEKYSDTTQKAWEALVDALSFDMFLEPWPIWHLADRTLLPRSVPIHTSQPYRLAVLPIREKVSDFVRACGQPYCDIAFFEIANMLQVASDGKQLEVVEVGANLGDCSMHLLGTHTASHVTLFEPMRELVEQLWNTVTSNYWIEFADVIPEAVGASIGMEELVQSGRRHGNWAEVGNLDAYEDSDNVDHWLTTRPAPRVQVRRTTVDQHAPHNVDLLKISVPGKSLDVLEGAERTLKTTRAIFLTVLPGYFEQPDKDLIALLTWLNVRNFVVDVINGEEDIARSSVIHDAVPHLLQQHVFTLVAWRDLKARDVVAPWPDSNSA